MFLHPVADVVLVAAILWLATALLRFVADRWRRRKMYRVLRRIRRILREDQ